MHQNVSPSYFGHETGFLAQRGGSTATLPKCGLIRLNAWFSTQGLVQVHGLPRKSYEVR